MQMQETSIQPQPSSEAPEPSTNDTPIDESLIELTAGEQKVVAEATATQKAAVEAAKPKEAVETDGEAIPKESAADAKPSAPPHAESTVVTQLQEIDTSVGYQPPVVARVLDPNAEKPDFDKTLADIKAQFDTGEIDISEYVEQRGQVIEARAEYNALVKIQAAEQARATQQAEQQWQATYSTFLAQPESADIKKDALHFNAFQAAINVVENEYAEKQLPPPSHIELLNKAVEVYNTAFGIKSEKSPVPTKPPLRHAPAMSDVPKTVSQAPPAGIESTRSDLDTYVEMDINTLEDRLAHLDSGKVDELLRQLAGANLRGEDA